MLHHTLHIAINVTNLPAADHFYGSLLGLTKLDRTLKFPGTWYQLGDFQVHLIVADFAVRRPEPTEKWGRYPHVAFAVPDLALIQAVLAEAGVPMQMSASGRKALFVLDPDGNVIELSEFQ
jgi:glyoxylase I family protein